MRSEEKNNPENTMVIEKAERGGTSGARADILLQPMEEIIPEQIITLQSMEDSTLEQMVIS